MKQLKVSIDGKKYDVGVEELGSGEFNVKFNKKKYAVKTEEVTTEDNSQTTATSTTQSSNTNSLTAQIPGTVGKVKIKQGESVKSGQILLTLIAMKMENEIKSPKDAKIKSIKVKEGDNVDVGHLLIEFEK